MAQKIPAAYRNILAVCRVVADSQQAYFGATQPLPPVGTGGQQSSAARSVCQHAVFYMCPAAPFLAAGL